MLALDSSHSRYPAIFLQSAEVAVPKSNSKSVAYENRTKTAKCGGLETNGPREKIRALNRLRRSAEVFARMPAVIGVRSALKAERRKLVAEVLAEREGFELPVGPISVWDPRFRCEPLTRTPVKN